MPRARASCRLPGVRISDAESLWYDTTRWPAWVDGLGHVVEAGGGWPHTGGRVAWESRPGGRGRVCERVAAHETRVGQTVEIEDPTLVGTQRVTFTTRDEGCDMTVELDYRLRDRGFGGAVADLLFVRRALRDSMARTVSRFAREVQARDEPAD